MRVAVLGLGSIGRRHARNLVSLGLSEVLAYDPAAGASEELCGDDKIRCYSRLEDLWNQKPDAVLVAAPSNTHVELALAAARRGCHLFIEKPLSSSTEGLDDLSAEIERCRLVNMVACNMRFHPGPSTVKSLLEAGAIGQVVAARIQTGSYLPTWRPGTDYRASYSASPEWGGAILDCIHEIDLALWYFGPAKLVCAARLPAAAIGLGTDGLAELLLSHSGGVLSNVHLNFVQRDYRRQCQVIGSEGTIYWDYERRHVAVYGPDGERHETLPEPPGWQANQMYMDELAHFLACVESGRQTVNPVADATATLGIALAARSTPH